MNISNNKNQYTKEQPTKKETNVVDFSYAKIKNAEKNKDRNQTIQKCIAYAEKLDW